MSVAISVPIVDAALTEAEATLAAAGVETPRADAEWLLAGILGVGRAVLAMNARLETFDFSILDAARDLGASPFRILPVPPELFQVIDWWRIRKTLIERAHFIRDIQ